MNRDAIHVVGASQHNLKHLNLDIPLNRITVVTGVSGSGKSSLAFDTLYAEGQRRYIETFSPYARQFMDRMDRPQVERIEGIPPAIAIDSKDPVRTSRSTVGTMTEITDYVKLLYARLRPRCTAAPAAARSPRRSPRARVAGAGRAARGRARSSSPSPRRPTGPTPAERRRSLAAGGLRPGLPGRADPRAWRRPRRRTPSGRWSRTASPSARATASACSTRSSWPTASAAAASTSGPPEAGTTPSAAAWSAPSAASRYASPLPSLFSFNSPVGACDTCRGFGRVIGIDLDLIIPDPARSLAEGADQALRRRGGRQAGVPGPRGLLPARAHPHGPALPGADRGAARGDRRAAPRPTTASRATSAGSRTAPTRCTCASSCRATAATTSARPAAGPASRRRRCSTGSKAGPSPRSTR